jgi:hypothetical protein
MSARTPAVAWIIRIVRDSRTVVRAVVIGRAAKIADR